MEAEKVESHENVRILRLKSQAATSEFFYSLLGCAILTFIALLYYLVPVATLALIAYPIFYGITRGFILCALVLILSVLLPAPECKALRCSWFFRSTAKYFETEIITASKEEFYASSKKNFLILLFPHGVISLGSLSAATLDPFPYGPTAVANILLYIPIIRHIFSAFGITSSNRDNLIKSLKKQSVILYPGGMAELFLSDLDKEEIYFENRKGCVKAAMQAGADIIVCYVFGNTQLFKVIKHGPLAKLSRSLKSAITFFWGICGLPIPYKTKVLFAVSSPIPVPENSDPSQEDVEKMHKKLKEKVIELFNEYKVRLVAFKDKELIVR